MSTSNRLTQFWMEFIELYKSLPQLWKTSHEGYAQKHLRNGAYEVLLEKYREFDEGACMDHLKKKIANMRTSFRREVKKVEECNSYEPTLWYYPHMEFIKAQGDDDNDDDDDNNESDDSDPDYGKKYIPKRSLKREGIKIESLTPPRQKKLKLSKPAYDSKPTPKRLLTPKTESPEHNNEETVSNPLKCPARQIPTKHNSSVYEAKTLSSTWEILFRKLDPEQRLYSNRLITEILYLGALQKLKSNSHKLFDLYLEQKKENSISISCDSNNKLGHQVSNLNDVLKELGLLKNYALQKNHEAIDLIMQLEGVFKCKTKQAKYRASYEDSDDYEQGDEDDNEEY